VGDIDATTGQAGVLRSVVDGAVGRCKAETSQQPVPLDQLTLGELQSWREVTMYAADSDWVFASERLFGKTPVLGGFVFAEGATACCDSPCA
jgi:hypothetical protein